MRKKPGPLPTGQGEPILVRLHDDILKPLDKFISRQDDQLSRPEAIRRILRAQLLASGVLDSDKKQN